MVRNWGDETVVDHGDLEIWTSMMNKYPEFVEKFLQGTMKSLQERRQLPMDPEEYDDLEEEEEDDI